MVYNYLRHEESRSGFKHIKLHFLGSFLESSCQLSVNVSTLLDCPYISISISIYPYIALDVSVCRWDTDPPPTPFHWGSSNRENISNSLLLTVLKAENYQFLNFAKYLKKTLTTFGDILKNYCQKNLEIVLL